MPIGRSRRASVDEVARDLREKLARVQAAMADRGIGGLIVFYGAQHNMLRMDQLRFLTDFKALGPSILLVPKEGDPSLLVTPAWDLERARESTPYKLVEAVDIGELARTAGALAAKLPKPLAIVGREVMPLGFARALAAQFNVEPVYGGDLVKALGETRTDVELKRVARAAEIADEGFRVLCDVA